MQRFTRGVVVGVGAVITATALAACGGSAQPSSTAADEAAPVGASAPASPMPTPTPAAPAGPEAINGTFHFVQQVTKSNMPNRKVGEEVTYDAEFTTTCAEVCTELVAVINGTTLKFVAKGDHWLYSTTQKSSCVITVDGKKTKEIPIGWRTDATYKLAPTDGSKPRTVVGTSNLTQTKPCRKSDKLQRTVSKSTGTEKSS